MADKMNNDELSLELFIVLARAYNSVVAHSSRDIQSHGLNTTEFGVLDLCITKARSLCKRSARKC